MKIKNHLLVWAFVLTSINSIGQTLVLDSLFGENGSKVLLGNNSLIYDTYKIVKTNDKKYLLGGIERLFYLGEISQGFIIKIDNCGILDTSFGENGRGTVILEKITDIEIQDDDKIIVGGSNAFPKLIRLNSDGSQDSLFDNSHESLFTSLNIFWGVFKSIEIQNDYKILCSGFVFTDDTTFSPMLMRFLPNGNIDSSFSDDGILLIDFGNYNGTITDGVINSFELFTLSSEKKNLIGSLANAVKAFSFTNEGIIESNFGVNGVFTDYEFGGFEFKAISVGDSILYAKKNLQDSIIIKRLLPEGFIDINFGENGRTFVLPNNEQYFTLSGLAKLPNNNFLIFSRSEFEGRMTKFDANGTLDNNFGIDGYISSANLNSNIFYKNLFILNDGRWIVTGSKGYYELNISRLIPESLVPNITYLNDTLYSNVESPVLSYQWFLNEIEIENAVNSTYQPTTSGNYSVTVTDTVECGQYTTNFELETVGLHSIKDKSLLVFPNPATDFIVVNGIAENRTFTITDIAGRVMLKGFTNGENSAIDISKISNGLYFFVTDKGNVSRFCVRK